MLEYCYLIFMLILSRLYISLFHFVFNNVSFLLYRDSRGAADHPCLKNLNYSLEFRFRRTLQECRYVQVHPTYLFKYRIKQKCNQMRVKYVDSIVMNLECIDHSSTFTTLQYHCQTVLRKTQTEINRLLHRRQCSKFECGSHE